MGNKAKIDIKHGYLHAAGDRNPLIGNFKTRDT